MTKKPWLNMKKQNDAAVSRATKGRRALERSEEKVRGKKARPDGSQERRVSSKGKQRADRPGMPKKAAGRGFDGGASCKGKKPSAKRPLRKQASTVQGAKAELQCPVANRCGACQCVNVRYDDQLKHKDRAMRALYSESLGWSGAETSRVFRPIQGMENPYHYRNKVVSPYAQGKKLTPSRESRAMGKAKSRAKTKGARYEILCGMYEAGTHRIISTEDCLVENEDAKRVIYTIQQLMPRFSLEPYNEDTGRGFVRHVVVRVGHTSGEMLVTIVTNHPEFPASRAFCRELVKRCPFVTTVVQNVNERQTNVILGQREQVLYGPGFILDNLCGLSFRISSQSFYQVNASQTEVLYKSAIDLAGFKGNETAIDAYCGTGTIGLVAARSGAKRVIGVDSVASAIRDAKENARHNGIENAEFVAEDAGAFMRRLASERAVGFEGQADDLVLLMDPPRAGSTEQFLRAASELAPQRIVYISCNPQTQVRDVALLQRFGYEVKAVQAVDMFPHTDHVECICLLTKA